MNTDILVVTVGLVLSASVVVFMLVATPKPEDQEKPTYVSPKSHSDKSLADRIEMLILNSPGGFVAPYRVSKINVSRVLEVARSQPERFKIVRAKYRGHYIKLK